MNAITDLQFSVADRREYRPSRHLSGTNLWRSPFLMQEERRALEQAVIWCKPFEAHKDLVSEAERSDTLLVVVSGWACRYSCVADGGRQLTALLVPGDITNLDTLLFEQVTYSVRTLTDTTIVALPRNHVLALADQYSGIARTFTSLAMGENAIAGKWLVSLGRRSAHARVAHLLCEIAIRVGGEDGNEASFAFPLRQEQIGDLLGLTNVHVNRMIQRLRGEGLVEICDRVVKIRDVAALRYEAGFDPAYLHMHQAVDATARPAVDVA